MSFGLRSSRPSIGDIPAGLEHVSGPVERVMADLSLKMRLSAALAEYDAAVARCPANNFAVERRTYGPKDRCSACGATAAGNCGKDAGASYRLVKELRSALEQAA